MNCIFCNLDVGKTANTILEETKNFIVIPSVGSLTDGYILIVAKKHLYNMFELSNEVKEEYFNLVEKYRCMFKQIYKKYPIVFEHGTISHDLEKSSSSIVHAHTHIVNHNYNDEKSILNKLYNTGKFDKRRNFPSFFVFNRHIVLIKNYIVYSSVFLKMLLCF